MNESSEATSIENVKDIWNHLSIGPYLLHHIYKELESWIFMSARKAVKIHISMVCILHLLWQQFSIFHLSAWN